jgi:hypothetical protein
MFKVSALPELDSLGFYFRQNNGRLFADQQRKASRRVVFTAIFC